MAADVAAPGQQIVERETSAVEQARRPSVHRHEERLGRDQMRSEAKKCGALMQGFAHQMKLELFEVAQAAVNQLRILAAGAGREVMLLNQGDFCAAHGEIPGDAGSVDAATENEDVKGLAAEALDVLRTGIGGEGRRQGHSGKTQCS